MIRIYKPSRSMRSNYRPLEFLICFSLTLCCPWSSTFIKSPMWLGWLTGTSWRLSLNTITVCMLTFVFKDKRKASSRTWFKLLGIVFCVLLPYCTPLFIVIRAMLMSLLLVTFAEWTCYYHKNRVIVTFLVSLDLAVFGGTFGRAASCGDAPLLKRIHLWESQSHPRL